MAEGNGLDVDPQTLSALRRLANSRGRSGRAAAARASAVRTLERLGRASTPPGPPPQLYTWELPYMDRDRRLQWLCLDLLRDMARARGWTITPQEWRDGSARIDELKREADVIMASEDPIASARAWIDDALARR